MRVYVVTEVTEDEYGGTEIVRAFATEEAAQAFCDARADITWRPWWAEEDRPVFTYQELEVE